MNDETRKWIEAGKILTEDPAAKVMCPACALGFLRIEDHSRPDEHDLVDRYLICDECGRHEVVLGVRTEKKA